MSDTETSFAQKSLIVIVGVLATALLAFFVWLALAVVEIRVNVAEMKRDIASLLASREVAEGEDRQRTGQRLDRLEEPRQ